MNKSLIASAIVMAFASAPAFADPAGSASDGTAVAVVSPMTTGKSVSLNALSGSVSNVQVSGIGNTIWNSGSNGGQGGGGMGGNATGGNGSGSGSAGGAITGDGVGASGGNGGHFVNDAGTINLSNTLSGTAQSAAGILIINQNTGIGALTQQSVNVQTNFAPGK